jgi:hypothetical protein
MDQDGLVSYAMSKGSRLMVLCGRDCDPIVLQTLGILSAFFDNNSPSQDK